MNREPFIIRVVFWVLALVSTTLAYFAAVHGHPELFAVCGVLTIICLVSGLYYGTLIKFTPEELSAFKEAKSRQDLRHTMRVLDGGKQRMRRPAGGRQASKAV